MDNENIKQLRVVEAGVGGPDVFSRALDGIIFGKGSTMIFMFRVGGFTYYTDKEAEGSQLEKVANKFSHHFLS